MNEINEHVIITTNPSVEVWLAAACLMHYSMHSPKPVAIPKDTKALPQELLNGEDKFIISKHTPAARYMLDLLNKGSSVTLISRGFINISFPHSLITHSISNSLLEIMYTTYPLLSYPMIAYGYSSGESNADYDYPLPPIIRAVQSAFLFERGLVTSIEECHSTLYNLLEEYIKQEPLPKYEILEDLFNMDTVKLYYWLMGQVKEPEACITISDIKQPDNVSLNFATKNDQVVKEEEEKPKAAVLQRDFKQEVQEEPNPKQIKAVDAISTKASLKPVKRSRTGSAKIYQKKRDLIPIPKQYECCPIPNADGLIYGLKSDSIYKNTSFHTFEVHTSNIDKYNKGCFMPLGNIKVGVINILPSVTLYGVTSTPNLFRLLKNDLMIDESDDLDIVIGVRNFDAVANNELQFLVYSKISNICLYSNDGGVIFEMFGKTDHYELTFDISFERDKPIRFTLQNPESNYQLDATITNSVTDSSVKDLNISITRKVKSQEGESDE